MRFERSNSIMVGDSEFTAHPGERTLPLCFVGQHFRSGDIVRLWCAQKQPPPISADDDLFVAFFASAEMGTFLANDWPMPKNVIDLHAENRVLTNGDGKGVGNGLVDAAQRWGVSVLPEDKDAMRALAMRGGTYTLEEQRALLDYCEQDVRTTVGLFDRLKGKIHWEHALLRGRYSKAVARMESLGVPIDKDLLDKLKDSWPSVCEQLIADTPGASRIFEGKNLRLDGLAEFLRSHNIRNWPRTKEGRLSKSEDTFDKMSLAYPGVVPPIAKLHRLLGKVAVSDLAVGEDGRNRSLISPFGQITGRNNPSSVRAIFGLPSALRSLIKPEPGKVLIYFDWDRQEFGIVAALSKDPRMTADYESDDPYLAFARRIGLVPEYASKETHPEQRELAKQVVLGMNYGMTAFGLSQRLNVTRYEAETLIAQHRRTYPRYWKWADGAVNYALLHGQIHSTFGWKRFVTPDATGRINLRSLQNFPAQANGAEMLRLACIFATEAGVRICAPVHDAILVESEEAEADEVTDAVLHHMARASELVLDGFRLRVGAKVVRHPERFIEERSRQTWLTIQRAVDNNPLHICHPREYIDVTPA